MCLVKKSRRLGVLWVRRSTGAHGAIGALKSFD